MLAVCTIRFLYQCHTAANGTKCHFERNRTRHIAFKRRFIIGFYKHKRKRRTASANSRRCIHVFFVHFSGVTERENHVFHKSGFPLSQARRAICRICRADSCIEIGHYSHYFIGSTPGKFSYRRRRNACHNRNNNFAGEIKSFPSLFRHLRLHGKHDNVA